MFEVQERVVAVETADELPNLDGYHCAEAPFSHPHPLRRPLTSSRLPSQDGEPDISREMPRLGSGA